MILETFPEIQKLSRKEKLILASELTDDYQAAPEDDEEMRGAILDLVSRRMEDFEKDPDSAVSLDEFRKKIERLKQT